MVLVVIPSYFKIIGNDRSMEFILSTDHIWTHLVLFAHSVAYGFSLTCTLYHALLGKEVIYLFSIAESTSAYSYTYMYRG